jgi:hypothetical protein
MFTVQGVCDWCKQSSYLAKHEYIDGKYHHACKSCNEHARLDVRQFNLAELAAQQHQPSQYDIVRHR